MRCSGPVASPFGRNPTPLRVEEPRLPPVVEEETPLEGLAEAIINKCESLLEKDDGTKAASTSGNFHGDEEEEIVIRATPYFLSFFRRMLCRVSDFSTCTALQVLDSEHSFQGGRRRYNEDFWREDMFLLHRFISCDGTDIRISSISFIQILRSNFLCVSSSVEQNGIYRRS